MKKILTSISLAILLFIVVMTFLYTADKTSQQTYNLGLLLGSLGWFATAPFWIKSE